jgi:hypothetical protein
VSGLSAASNSVLACNDGLAEGAQFIGFHRIEADSEKTVVRRDVEIEQPLVLLGARAGDDRADMGVVGMLFLGETDVAVDAEGRGLAGAGERDLFLGEPCGQIVNQPPARLVEMLLEDRLVLVKPFAVLVKAESLEEGQALSPKP